ncbi:helix-hairpin-helix domain-containing protein [Paenibacillus sp. XY044]|uniref:ComEA family DNA-binding protein n=1 Tax=Paenibacillus sp. XY044 TaxID=2026089 RepID=UPI00211AFE2D|nr:helix-hairpin-helix domain-containing protein [Paenibacillus sp. XY044]
MKRISAVASVVCAVLGSGAILLSGVHTSSGMEQWQPLNGRVESVLSEQAGEPPTDAARTGEKQKQEQASKQDVKQDAEQQSVTLGSAQQGKDDIQNTVSEKAQNPGTAVSPGQEVIEKSDPAQHAANAESGQVKKINVNTAGLSELTGLPGIGEAKAKAILEYRDQHGPFKSVADLDKVKGIGPKMLEKMKPYIEL